MLFTKKEKKIIAQNDVKFGRNIIEYEVIGIEKDAV